MWCSRNGAQVGDDSHLPHVHGGAGHVCGWFPGQPNDINFFPSPCWLCSPQLGAQARQQLPPQHTPLPVPMAPPATSTGFVPRAAQMPRAGCTLAPGMVLLGQLLQASSSFPTCSEATPKCNCKQGWGQDRAKGKETTHTYHLFSNC